jgi:hypothetical protein
MMIGIGTSLSTFYPLSTFQHWTPVRNCKCHVGNCCTQPDACTCLKPQGEFKPFTWSGQNANRLIFSLYQVRLLQQECTSLPDETHMSHRTLHPEGATNCKLAD